MGIFHLFSKLIRQQRKIELGSLHQWMRLGKSVPSVVLDLSKSSCFVGTLILCVSAWDDQSSCESLSVHRILFCWHIYVSPLVNACVQEKNMKPPNRMCAHPLCVFVILWLCDVVTDGTKIGHAWVTVRTPGPTPLTKLASRQP